MFIKKLHRNVFDVFLGKGYEKWVRVKRTHFGVAYQAGVKQPHHILKQIATHLH